MDEREALEEHAVHEEQEDDDMNLPEEGCGRKRIPEDPLKQRNISKVVFENPVVRQEEGCDQLVNNETSGQPVGCDVDEHEKNRKMK